MALKVSVQIDLHTLADATRHEQVCALFTKGTHNKHTSGVWFMQDLFCKGKIKQNHESQQSLLETAANSRPQKVDDIY
jgi:hypothetical protein